MAINRAGKITIILAGLFFVSGYSAADEIRLKSGRILQGEIIEEAEDSITFRLKVGKTAVPRSEIESIDRKELPDGFFATEQEQPQPSEPPVKEKDDKLPYDLSVMAGYEADSDSARVKVSGNATLPNGSSVDIFIKRRGRFVSSGKTSVFDGKYAMDFRFSRRRFFPAVYDVTAIFIPERQSADVRKALQGNFAAGTKIRTAEACCRLYAGRLKDIVEEEVKAKCGIGSAITRLEMLHSEFSRKYAACRKRFSAKEWDKWSYTWMLYMRGVQKKNDPRNVLYPAAEENITMAVNSLLKLWQYCNLELRDPVAYNKIRNDPKTRIRPDELKKLLDEREFEALLDNIRKEASMEKAEK